MHKNIATETKVSMPAGAEEHLHSHSFQDVEDLTNELKRLLVSHENTLNEHGLRSDVETLERWMESYRRGLSAARKISETGASLLNDLRGHLKLAIDERHRLEGEGGNSATKEEANSIDELIKTVGRIDGMLPNIEHIFHAAEEEHENA